MSPFLWRHGAIPFPCRGCSYCAVKKVFTEIFARFFEAFAKFFEVFESFFEVFASFSRLSGVSRHIQIHSDPQGCICMVLYPSHVMDAHSVPWIFFLKLTSGNVKKNDSKIPQISIFFENVQTLPIASECVRMHPNGSGWIRMGPNTSENFENLAKTLKKSKKTPKHFAKIFVKTFFTAQ